METFSPHSTFVDTLPTWAGWGLYVHVPFCERKCPYCDFTVAVLRRRPELPYIEALWREYDARVDAYVGPLKTIYFGGGTPGLLVPESIDAWAEGARARMDIEALEEFTVEFNPEHMDDARLAAWRRAGATRISLGVQALHPHALQRLGRHHSVEDAVHAVERARAHGFEHISLDFIFAVPDVDPEKTYEDVQRAIAMKGVDHISLYELTVEERTVFGVLRRDGKLPELPETPVLEHWRALSDLLESEGFERYEVSNFARKGGHARHNRSYWVGRPYLGLGVSAASLRASDNGQASRRSNRLPLRAYLEDPLGGASEEHLQPFEHLSELLCLGIRRREGLNLVDLQERFGLRLNEVSKLLEKWAAEGLVLREQDDYRMARAAMEMADSLALEMLDALDSDTALLA